jgi:hypothetical protein
MLAGRTTQIISTLRQLAAAPTLATGQQTVLTNAANYFERNAAYMHYDQYLANGWPIASGVIEGACRHLVKDRYPLPAHHAFNPPPLSATLGVVRPDDVQSNH